MKKFLKFQELFGRLVAFRIFVLKEVEQKIRNWHKRRIIDSRHRDRLLKLFEAEREMIPWGIEEAKKSLGPIIRGQIIDMWEKDKQSLAEFVKAFEMPQLVFVHVIDYLHIGPQQMPVKTAALEIKRSMEPFGISINEGSLITQYYRRLKAQRMRKE